MKLMVSDVEGVKSFLEERQGQFVMENSVLDISVDSLDAAIELITEINHAFSVTYIELEAPSFDKAVIKLMGDKHA